MRNELVPTIPIRQVLPDEITKEMSDWFNTVAKRAYETFANSGFTHGHDLDDWFKAEKDLFKPVAARFMENNDVIMIDAELPGFEANEVQVHVNGNCLVIRGERQSMTGNKSKTGPGFEEKTERVYRSIELPVPVVVEEAKAELKAGILHLVLPKAAKSKQIKVAAA